MSKLTQELVDNINSLLDEGYSQRAACSSLGIPESTWRTWRDRGKLEELKKSIEESTQVEDIEDVLDEELEKDCVSTDVHIASLAKRLRTAQKTNTQLRKVINGSIKQEVQLEEVVQAINLTAAKLQLPTAHKGLPVSAKGSTPATAEILFSDLQVGKVGQYYNTELARKALQKYSTGIMQELNTQEYSFERIILACLGDIVEDHLKHGVQSATSTDSGLAEQMANAIAWMWEFLVQPLGSLGVPLEVICVAGNHGSSEHKGMDMYKAGLFSYDYPIYKALEGYCKAAGWNHIKFIIPEGCFAYTEIYGRTAVYEHGYFNTCTEKSLVDQKGKRGRQIKRHVEYFRCGDMHHVCDYNNGQEVVNGALFGVDNEGVEYSGILGFNSIPAQKMMVHTKEDSIGRNTIKRNINIQVADGY